MMVFNTFITQSLSPALAISSIGMLALGLNTRIIHLGGRIRQLNREMAEHPNDAAMLRNLQRQIGLFMRRTMIVRNAMFLLYSALVLMIGTAFALALTQLNVLPQAWHIPVWTFLGGLVFILIAVLMEAFEIMLNLESLRLDVALFNRMLPEPTDDSDDAECNPLLG